MTPPPAETPAPHSLQAIEAAHAALAPRVIETPVVALASDRIAPHLPAGCEPVLKLEIFQQSGSFKARGALLNIDALGADERAAGVTAVSAGNHALAVSWAAAREGVPAKVVMLQSSDPVRISGCRALGAEVVLAPDVAAAFEEVARIEAEEGRAFIHPFDAPLTLLGTATCGLEFSRQAPGLDAVIVPIGGGGLIAGMARAFKLTQPGCTVYGVEPEGADTMHRSFAAGAPQKIERVRTIADSLGAPMALPYSFGEARRHVDELVLIDDGAMLRATALLFDALKIAVEPAAAAAT
ncbi:MAG: pyridoxal-phosphate dependent enzyme, partial [Alphaproteobacteria bacterium]